MRLIFEIGEDKRKTKLINKLLKENKELKEDNKKLILDSIFYQTKCNQLEKKLNWYKKRLNFKKKKEV